VRSLHIRDYDQGHNRETNKQARSGLADNIEQVQQRMTGNVTGTSSTHSEQHLPRVLLGAVFRTI